MTLPEIAPRDHFVVNGPGGTRLASRRMFSCPKLFEQEFTHIWEKVWVYLAHESQLPNPKDYLTTYIGRVPVIVNRNKAGTLGCFVNICTHRGSTLCRMSRGNLGGYSCPFHGWYFDLDGNLAAPLSEATGAYPEGFDKSRLGLRRVRLENYRGFLFGTLDDKAESLADYLAEAKAFIDLIVDQAPNGLEMLKGVSTYTYDGNWKMQAENGIDGYHVAAVHGNYSATIKQRMRSKAAGEKTKPMNIGDFGRSTGGFYDLGRGHGLVWGDWTNPEARPMAADQEELAQRMGSHRAEWVIGRLRNMLVYPNVFFMDQMSSQIRTFRPLAVDRTEVTIRCFAPVGEAPASRAKRIRQYEDFFNASGMATPDDLTEFTESFQGCRHHNLIPYSELSRGAAHEVAGADALARELGISPLASGGGGEDEGVFVAQHRRWAELMAPALADAEPGEASR